MEELYITGNLAAIYFQNDTNYYKVLLIEVVDTNTAYLGESIVVTGTIGSVHEGSEYTFYGQLVEHAKYGQQFQASHYQQESLSSASGLIRYLSSDKFPGIGEVLAGRIVDALGEETIEKILTDPDCLKGIKGLPDKKRDQLVEILKADQVTNQGLITLLKYGFSDQQAYKISQIHKASALDILQENPYLFLESIEGMPFGKVDDVASQLGFEANCPERYRGGIFYALKELSYRQGHTYFDGPAIVSVAIQVLEKSRKELIDQDALEATLVNLIQVGIVAEDQQRLALPSLYYAEIGIANKVHKLLKRDQKTYAAKDIEAVIESIESKNQIQYADKQKEAIAKAIQAPLSILTGGPGTGKTTVLKGIVQAYALLNDINLSQVGEHDSPILLAAPTGRAAKRMKELIGLPAVTLHRLLGIGITGQELPNPEGPDFNSLEGKVLIIDEMSMVDTWLMNWVFKALSAGMQLILVGDKNQLPSVGPGQVLHDLLTYEAIPTTQLDTVFRQDEKSTIASLAHEIKNGVFPDNFTQNLPDRSFFEVPVSQVGPLVVKVLSRALEKGYDINDVQVLAPMYKGPAGIDALNQLIQEAINPKSGKKREVDHFGCVFRVKDKVLQQVNVPEKNVFNGDIGQVVGIIKASESEDKTEELVVAFDDNEVHYKKSEWNQLTLAYCCSIHKAQGSEFPLVILPLVQSYGRMLRRDLLYTAMTRSKQALVFCGQATAFHEATIQLGTIRHTLLAEKLQEDSKTLAQAAKAGQQASNDFLKEKEALKGTTEHSQNAGQQAEKAEEKAEKSSEKPKANQTSVEETLARAKGLRAEGADCSEQNETNEKESHADQFESLEPESRLLTLQNYQTIDPMIGMTGLRPEMFMEEKG